jgi:hypothetical protein
LSEISEEEEGKSEDSVESLSSIEGLPDEKKK